VKPFASRPPLTTIQPRSTCIALRGEAYLNEDAAVVGDAMRSGELCDGEPFARHCLAPTFLPIAVDASLRACCRWKSPRTSPSTRSTSSGAEWTLPPVRSTAQPTPSKSPPNRLRPLLFLIRRASLLLDLIAYGKYPLALLDHCSLRAIPLLHPV
jgi:hypothetical protein